MFSSFISLGLSWLPGPLGILAALASHCAGAAGSDPDR